MYSHPYPTYPQQVAPPYAGYPPPQPMYPVPASSYGQYAQHYLPPPPPPPAPHMMPPEEFQRWYTSKLSELVVNNRNIIQGLAFIASDNAQRHGSVVADCIELHIRRAHPQIKLPAWYLLDSIAKNVGHPYVQLFGRFVVRLFLDSYFAVDVPTRSKMEEMLVTWRTGGPRGVELFGIEVQNDIERGVWPTAPVSTTSSTPSRPSGPTKAQVLTELEVTLAQKLQAVKTNPNDEESLGHVDALNQLRQLIQTSVVSQAELSTIATQLRSLARSAASAAAPLPPVVPPPQQAVYPPPQPQRQAVYPAPGSGVYPPPPIQSLNGSMSVSSAPVVVPTPPPVSVAAPAPAPADISTLFQNLVKAGVVTAPGVSSAVPPAPASVPVVPAFTLPSLSTLSSLLAASGLASKNQSETSSSTPSVVSDQRSDATKAYEQMILNSGVTLTSSGIQRERPEFTSFLYERLSVQCKQCALRFPTDGPESKKKYEDHIDMHFRQNLRNATASTSTGVGTMGRGYTRSWFVGRNDWVHDVTADASTTGLDKGKGRALSPSSGPKASAEAREAKLRASRVVVPAGDEAKAIKCPICKEEMKTEFFEEDEDWVWRNATSIKGKVYHATCHADALAASLARLKSEAVGRSRSQTPDRPTKLEDKPLKTGTPVPSPLAGTKRKAGDRDGDDPSATSTPSESGVRTPPNVVVKVEDVDESPRPTKKLAT